MPGSFVDVGCRGARALAAGWWSRRRVLAGSEDLHPSLAVLALELARKAGAGAGAKGLQVRRRSVPPHLISPTYAPAARAAPPSTAQSLRLRLAAAKQIPSSSTFRYPVLLLSCLV
jgi:hypothetical protein